MLAGPAAVTYAGRLVALFPRLYISLFALFFVAACGAPRQRFAMVFDACEPLVLVTPDDVSASEQGSITDAIAMWHAVANVGLMLEENADAAHLPVRFERTALYMGRFDDKEGVVWLARGVDERAARAIVLAHELGHAMGLYHVDKRRSVMRAGNNRVPPLPEDGAALVRVWGQCAALVGQGER